MARVPVVRPVQAPRRTGRSAPKAKLPEGKSTPALCSGDVLAINRGPSCHSCRYCARYLELLAKRRAQSKHLIWFFHRPPKRSSSAPSPGRILKNVWTSLGLKSALFLLATGVLHLLYTESLLRGYRAGDLTMVYPLARGTGPLLSSLGAEGLLHEHLSLLAATGAVLVSFGDPCSRRVASRGSETVTSMPASSGAWRRMHRSQSYLVDGYSVKTLLLFPILVDYAAIYFVSSCSPEALIAAIGSPCGVFTVVERSIRNRGAYADRLHSGVVCDAPGSDQPCSTCA